MEYGAAFALALSGESSRSRALAKDLETRFPEDTAVKGFYLPAIRALLELSGANLSKRSNCCKSPDPMIAAYRLPSLQRLSDHSLQSMCVAWPIWPHTKAPKPPRNSRKFSITAAIVVSDPIGALAHLQLGRAFALSGDKAKAKAAYQDFLTLWKDADADIPILKQAKAEYAKLQ